jgi:heat shock protein HslJ
MERDRNRVRLTNMRRLGLCVTALAGAVVLTACGNGDDDTTVVPDDGDPGSQTEETPLAETYWELGGVSANDTTTELSEDVGAYLQITDGAVGGNTGCNTFGGDAEINAEDGTVTFADVISTMRACSPPCIHPSRSSSAARACGVKMWEGSELSSGTSSGQQPSEIPFRVEPTIFRKKTRIPGRQVRLDADNAIDLPRVSGCPGTSRRGRVSGNGRGSNLCWVWPRREPD